MLTSILKPIQISYLEVMNKEIVTLQEDVSSSPLYGEDLAPVPPSKRTWSTWNLAALWVGMAVCIPTYMLAADMIKTGISWWSALLIIGLANVIITLPMVMNGHAGVKYGIPFPVIGRASFGTRGIHLAAVIRAIVACGWFGIQTWIGGLAIYAIYHALMGSSMPDDLTMGKFICFGIFWLVNIFFVWRGTESIKWLEIFAAPILIVIGLMLIGWGAQQAGGFAPVLEQSEYLARPSAYLEEGKKTDIDEFYVHLSPIPLRGREKENFFKAHDVQIWIPTKGDGYFHRDKWTPINNFDPKYYLNNTLEYNLDAEGLRDGSRSVKLKYRKLVGPNQPKIESSKIDVFFPDKNKQSNWWTYLMLLTAMVGFWATMSLSIADITRYASSQKAQVAGQFIGLPGTMILFSFVGIFVTCASLINFDTILVGEDAPWDPVSLVAKFEHPWVVIIAQCFMLVATLSTNIAANVIAPANAFSNLFPQKISFRVGGVITGIIGILICPWWLINYLIGLLIFVSGLLGPVLGIMLCDYFLIRKRELHLAELFKPDGEYAYGGSGFNPAAMIAMGVGVGFVLLGYFIPALSILYSLSWFTGFGMAFLVYWLLMRKK